MRQCLKSWQMAIIVEFLGLCATSISPCTGRSFYFDAFDHEHSSWRPATLTKHGSLHVPGPCTSSIIAHCTQEQLWIHFLANIFSAHLWAMMVVNLYYETALNQIWFGSWIPIWTCTEQKRHLWLWLWPITGFCEAKALGSNSFKIFQDSRLCRFARILDPGPAVMAWLLQHCAAAFVAAAMNGTGTTCPVHPACRHWRRCKRTGPSRPLGTSDDSDGFSGRVMMGYDGLWRVMTGEMMS